MFGKGCQRIYDNCGLGGWSIVSLGSRGFLTIGTSCGYIVLKEGLWLSLCLVVLRVQILAFFSIDRVNVVFSFLGNASTLALRCIAAEASFYSLFVEYGIYNGLFFITGTEVCS